MSRVVHFEINADDPKRAINFYQNVFGWKIEKWDGPMDYWMINTGAANIPGINGGLMKREMPQDNITSYISVPSADESAAKIKAQGGQIIQPKTEVMGVGYIAVAKDTEGNVFGIIESKTSKP